MRRFLTYISLFSMAVVVFLVWLFYQADGYTDPFYVKISTPKQRSLVLGNSKASQAIQPHIVDSILPEAGMFNYAFTIPHSPFGAAYLRGIKKKLEKKSTNGIFIVAVDPWGIAVERSTKGSPQDFEENKAFLNRLNSVSSHPNVFYLLKHYKKSYLRIFKRDSTQYVHDNGWLEVSTSMDSEIIKKRIETKVVEYTQREKKYVFSQHRLDYLYRTIEYLNTKGEVFLVRLPTDPRITQIENNLISDFNFLMEQLSISTEVPYYDMSVHTNNYVYLDGMHLHKSSGKEVSVKISNWIREKRLSTIGFNRTFIMDAK